jgi:hypothetical protein
VNPALPRKRPHRVAGKVIALLAFVPAVAAVLVEAPVPMPTRALITLLWILSLSPAYQYFRKAPQLRRPLPFFPAISAAYGLYFAFPLTIGVTDQYYNAPIDPTVDYELPVQLAFFGWIAMVSGYAIVSVYVKERAPAQLLTWDPKYIARAGLALFAGAVGMNLLKAWLGGSFVSGGVYQFVISLQWLGAGLLTVLARRGELSRGMQMVLVAGILLTVGMMLAIGSIAPAVMFLAILGFGLWIGKPVMEFKWVALAVVLALAATSFRGVAIDFRKVAWFGSQNLTQTERLGLMWKLLQIRAERDGIPATILHGIAETGGRSADLDLFANVVRRTPTEVPYWGGQTYASLVGSFVPRFIWPDKPTKELGQAFGHRYGLIYWTNTSTAINLPILVEFYINFATLGVIVGMFLTGIIYRVLDSKVNRPGQSPVLSMIGGVLLLPLLLIESDFSLVFGGIPLNAIALWFIWHALNRTMRPAVNRYRAPVRGVAMDPSRTLAGSRASSERLLSR